MIQKVFSRFLILAALLAPAVRAESPTWTARFDLDLGVIHDVAAGGGVAYAATYNGVFRSMDGRRWEAAGLQGRGIGLVVAAAGESVFAVEFSGSLWVSLDGGGHWKASDPGAPVSALAVDPDEPNTVWAGSYFDGVLRTSEDRGEHWAGIEINTNGYGIQKLLFDSVDGTLYAQTTDLNFYSKPAGAAWQRVRHLEIWMESIVAGGSAPGVLYGVSDRGFCVSSDHGATWPCSQGPGPTGGRLALAPAEGSLPPRLLWAAGATLRTSDDGGNSWRAVSLTGPYPPVVTSLAVDQTSGRIFAGSANLALRSDDRGESWDHVAAGLRAAWIESLAAGPDALWAGSGTAFESLMTSTDEGDSWALETLPSQPVAITDIIVDPINSAVYAGGEYSLFRKAPGEGWTHSGLPSYLFALAADPSTPQRLWLGSSDGARYSDNSGSTWTGTSLAQAVYALVVDPLRPSRIHAGSDYEFAYGYYNYPSGGAIFTSNDSGQTWAKSSDVGSAVQSIALDPFDSERIYAGTRFNGVVTSFDGGVTWRSPSSSPAGELRVLAADPTRPATLYAGTASGVHRSRDFGRSWLPFGEGLATLDVRSLAISTDGRLLHAGTAGLGVFDLALEDEPVPGFPCVPGPSRLCFLGNRFQVELIAQTKGGGEPENGEAHSLGDRAGYFGIPAFTGDGAAPEVVVKMLPNGAFGVDGSPILYSSMTGAAFALRVTDTVKGIETAYRSDSSRPFCGGADLIAIDKAGSKRQAATIPAPVAQGLSLLGGRFTVSLEARTRSGIVAAGVPFASGDRYGFFSLPGITGDPGLPELVVKMLDGRGFNDAFWVFRGSLTGLDYTLTVHDEQTGITRTYESDVSFCGGADIDAFPE